MKLCRGFVEWLIPHPHSGVVFKVYAVLALRARPDCSAQWQCIPAVPNRKVFLQCPTAEYPCSAQPQGIPAVLNHQVSLQCSMPKCPCRAQPLQCRIPQHLPLQCQTATFLQCICSGARKGFRVGMLEENNLTSPTTQGNHVSPVTIVCHQHRANFPHPRQFRHEAFHKGLFLVTMQFSRLARITLEQPPPPSQTLECKKIISSANKGTGCIKTTTSSVETYAIFRKC